MLKEFRDFILKGNAIDLAVGVLIGAAFGTLVKSITDGIIRPLIQWVGGDVDVTFTLWIFDIGSVINAAIALGITGAILFFVFVKPMNKLRTLQAKNEPPPPSPEPGVEEKLLTEIRDLLKQRS